MMLPYLRRGDTFAEFCAGLGVSTATACRFVSEAVALQSTRTHSLHPALGRAPRDGLLYPVLDGTLIPVDRVAADRPFYCAKHGMNFQFIATADGHVRVWGGHLSGR